MYTEKEGSCTPKGNSSVGDCYLLSLYYNYDNIFILQRDIVIAHSYHIAYFSYNAAQS